jgi:hypothetical protein
MIPKAAHFLKQLQTYLKGLRKLSAIFNQRMKVDGSMIPIDPLSNKRHKEERLPFGKPFSD